MHSVLACGIIREVFDSDGYRVIRVSTCVHGYSCHDRMTPEWAPIEDDNDPVCPRCHRPAKTNWIRCAEGAVHQRCLVPKIPPPPKVLAWPPEREAVLIELWNAGTPLPAIAERLGITRTTLDNRVHLLRKRGVELRWRRGKGHGSRPVTPLMRQAHDLTSVGAFGG